MEFKRNTLLYFLVAFLILGCKNNDKNKPDQASKIVEAYILVKDWPKLPDNFILGSPTGLGLDSKGNIIAFHRSGRVWETNPISHLPLITENTISTIDSKTGEILNAWGNDLFIMPHGLEVDQHDNIWVTDCGLHQVFKFDADGNLLLTLGEAKVPGNDAGHFNLPTDVAVSADGSFYVSDGYGNSRVVKFSKDGTYLFEWGKFGNKEGEFNIPHGIDLDKNGNVYVADRENNRIQKFDGEGNFNAVWHNEITEQLYSVMIDNKRNHVFGIDYMTVNDTVVKGSDIFRFDLELNLQLQFGRTGFYDGPISRYHDIQIDNEGNIYVGDILGNQIQKFRLKTSK
ncbi:peptidyl-alpha-hydroxyglycine alpha-amidating lyase family protein [Namhaeicola litoreus]|uniref:peptidylamidoglycolate lyase n=1 Tax=Namhaeicola litoreus TaxID=1052145 RepID=A0ABW3Y128_9FLAO